MTRKEFNRFLNWLLSYGIIDMNEYNALLLKAIPYLKR